MTRSNRDRVPLFVLVFAFFDQHTSKATKRCCRCAELRAGLQACRPRESRPRPPSSADRWLLVISKFVAAPPASNTCITSGRGNRLLAWTPRHRSPLPPSASNTCITSDTSATASPSFSRAAPRTSAPLGSEWLPRRAHPRTILCARIVPVAMSDDDLSAKRFML